MAVDPPGEAIHAVFVPGVRRLQDFLAPPF